jgi:hypothetical protein
MHAVVRHYKGSAKLMDELATRQDEVEELIRGVPGFVSYCLLRTEDGGASITMCQDEAGTAESVKRAAAYIKENLDGIAAGPPEIIEGETFIDFTA